MFTPLCASSIQDCLMHLLSHILCLESQVGYSPAHTFPPVHVLCAVLFNEIRCSEKSDSAINKKDTNLSYWLWVQWFMVIETRVLTRRCRPSNGRAIDLLQRIMPADVGEAAMARPAPPLRAVGVEVAILKEGSGTAVSCQVGGAQLQGRVGERVRWVHWAVAVTAPAWAS